MELQISWATIGKIAAAGFGTYVLLPGALVLRDWLLREVVERFVLNANLQRQISEYAWKESRWNQEYAKPAGGCYRDREHIFFVGEKEVSKEEYFIFSAKQHSIQQELRALYVGINRKSAFVNWIYRQYKQEDVNPIPEWLDDERKRFSKSDIDGGDVTPS